MTGTFIQLIDFTTKRPDEVRRLLNRWFYATGGRRTSSGATYTAVEGEPGRYVSIVEFPTEGDARANAGLPETDTLARQLAEVCSRVTYTDLNVIATFRPATAVRAA